MFSRISREFLFDCFISLALSVEGLMGPGNWMFHETFHANETWHIDVSSASEIFGFCLQIKFQGIEQPNFGITMFRILWIYLNSTDLGILKRFNMHISEEIVFFFYYYPCKNIQYKINNNYVELIINVDNRDI